MSSRMAYQETGTGIRFFPGSSHLRARWWRIWYKTVWTYSEEQEIIFQSWVLCKYQNYDGSYIGRNYKLRSF
jgi:hypothetical protein